MEQRGRGDLAGGDCQLELSAGGVAGQFPDEREGTESADHGGILGQSKLRWKSTF